MFSVFHKPVRKLSVQSEWRHFGGTSLRFIEILGRDLQKLFAETGKESYDQESFKELSGKAKRLPEFGDI